MANMTKTLKLTLLALFLFQILVSMGFELAHDEAYYWIYSRHLDWGYFDHPPFVGVVIKLFSFLPPSEWAVRFGFILLQFGSLFFLFALGASPLVSTLLFFSFPLASFTGLLALPDIPLLFMTGAYCYALKKYLEKDSFRISLCLGLIIALLFYAKYHGVLLILFTILALPKILARKSFYLVALVALVCFFPHLWWQYQHDFSTLRYHFLERPSATFSLGRSLEYIGLQMGLAGVFVGPVVWYVLIKSKAKNQFERAMKFISLGTVFFFLVSSFSKRVEANWTIFLTIPTLSLITFSVIWQRRWARSLLWSSFLLVVMARLLFLLSPEKIGLKRLKEFHGWKSWAQEVKIKCGERSLMANSYQIASKLSYYLGQEINALNYRSRKNQFDYWRFDKNLPTKEVCYVTDKMEFQGEDLPTPEGKNLRIVKNQSLESLWALKYDER
jgi:4-amino-4-deoxy-L-arabinose transferase-like glycosyltransferase